MRLTKREDGPTPSGNAYSITEWDDQTGDATTREFTESGELVCRHEWRPPQTQYGTGEVVTFDAADREIGRRPLPVEPVLPSSD
jgi:hypothetical protein